jgi:hypothetical protein
MYRRILGLAFLALMLGMAPFSGAASPIVMYDATSEFEPGWNAQHDPNGVWSYGRSSAFTGPITLYTETVQNGINGPNAQYWLSPSADVQDSPSAEFNNGPAFDDTNVSFLANEFILVAGIDGEFSDLVFTAPVSGVYDIASSFRGSQHGVGTDVGVVGNGNLLFSSTVTSVGQLVPFSTEVTLNAGNTVVFAVGAGGGLQNTGLAATVSLEAATAPEPSTLAFLGAGTTLLVFYKRRRRIEANKAV